jgi:hypothetical protein
MQAVDRRTAACDRLRLIEGFASDGDAGILVGSWIVFLLLK